MRKPLSYSLATLALALFSGLSSAQSEAPSGAPLAEHIATVIEAQPIKRVDPKYPPTSARKNQEGWVKVSFVINKDGEVEDPVVQDSSGLKAFEKATLRAVKRWQYSPAIQDGEAIQQCRNMVQIDFRLAGSSGVTRKFMRRYKAVSEAITNKDLPLAAELIAEMRDDQLWNHTESAYFWLADSYYAKATDDTVRELKSVRRALAVDTDAVRTSTKQYLLEREFVLSINESEYNEAMKAYDKLEKIADEKPEQLAQLAPYAEKVKELVKGNEPMIRKASINEDGRVFHQLSRNAFALDIAEGDLDEVQIRCDNKLSRYTAVSKSQWHIPSSWGQCSVYVSGSPGAQFEVVEVGDYIGEI